MTWCACRGFWFLFCSFLVNFTNLLSRTVLLLALFYFIFLFMFFVLFGSWGGGGGVGGGVH